MKAEKLRFRKWDLCAIGAVLLLGVVAFLAFLPKSNQKAGIVQVYQDGKLVFESPIDRNARYTAEGAYRNIVVIEDGKVYIGDSNCPGKDCVHSGSIRTPGRNIVCMPNRVEVRVVGQSNVDAVVR